MKRCTAFVVGFATLCLAACDGASAPGMRTPTAPDPSSGSASGVVMFVADTIHSLSGYNPMVCGGTLKIWNDTGYAFSWGTRTTSTQSASASQTYFTSATIMAQEMGTVATGYQEKTLYVQGPSGMEPFAATVTLRWTDPLFGSPASVVLHTACVQ